IDGKVTINKGYGQRIGESHATVFVEEGAKVIITDINKEGGQALADRLGENAVFIENDVTDLKSWESAVKKGIEKFGDITVLVNNAGVLGPIAKNEDLIA